MSQSEDAAAAVGFQLRTLLTRYDELHSIEESWRGDLESDEKIDRVLMARDGVAACARRIIRYFVAGAPRHPEELDPSDLIPAWVPPQAAADRLRTQLTSMDLEFACLTKRAVGEGVKDWPFALILATLLDVADAFAWELRAADPEAARHLDHNLVELRQRLR